MCDVRLVVYVVVEYFSSISWKESAISERDNAQSCSLRQEPTGTAPTLTLYHVGLSFECCESLVTVSFLLEDVALQDDFLLPSLLAYLL